MSGLTDLFNQANSVLGWPIITNKYLIPAGWVISVCMTQFYKYLLWPSEQVAVERTGTVVYGIPEVEPTVWGVLTDVPAGLVWRGEQPVVNVVVFLQRTFRLLHQFRDTGAKVVTHLLARLLTGVVILAMGILLKLSRHKAQLTPMTFEESISLFKTMLCISIFNPKVFC